MWQKKDQSKFEWFSGYIHVGRKGLSVEQNNDLTEVDIHITSRIYSNGYTILSPRGFSKITINLLVCIVAFVGPFCSCGYSWSLTLHASCQWREDDAFWFSRSHISSQSNIKFSSKNLMHTLDIWFFWRNNIVCQLPMREKEVYWFTLAEVGDYSDKAFIEKLWLYYRNKSSSEDHQTWHANYPRWEDETHWFYLKT